MAECPKCNARLAEVGQFCSACGVGLFLVEAGASATPTRHAGSEPNKPGATARQAVTGRSFMYRPAPILIAIVLEALMCASLWTQQHDLALHSAGYYAGRDFGFWLSAFALVLNLLGSNVGRWLSVAFFSLIGGFWVAMVISGLITNVPVLTVLTSVVLALPFLALAYFLAFGKSTKAYFAGHRKGNFSTTSVGLK